MFDAGQGSGIVTSVGGVTGIVETKMRRIRNDGRGFVIVHELGSPVIAKSGEGRF